MERRGLIEGMGGLTSMTLPRHIARIDLLKVGVMTILAVNGWAGRMISRLESVVVHQNTSTGTGEFGIVSYDLAS